MSRAINIWSEWAHLQFTEHDNNWRGQLRHFLRGQVDRTDYYSVPKADMPTQLLIVLCEAEDLGRLSYEHEQLIWELVDEQYEL